MIPNTRNHRPSRHTCHNEVPTSFEPPVEVDLAAPAPVGLVEVDGALPERGAVGQLVPVTQGMSKLVQQRTDGSMVAREVDRAGLAAAGHELVVRILVGATGLDLG